MNRIWNIFNKIKRKHSAEEYLISGTGPVLPSNAGQPERCSFCGRSLCGCPFTAHSLSQLGPVVGLCSACIGLYANLSKFSHCRAPYYEAKPDFGPIKRMFFERLHGEGASSLTKSVVVDFALRLLKRASAMAAECPFAVCPKTGVPLTVLRAAFVGPNASRSAHLLELLCAEVGLITFFAIPDELSSGEAYKALVERIGEIRWADAVGILICNGYVPAQTSLGVVYLVHSDEELPPEIERIE